MPDDAARSGRGGARRARRTARRRRARSCRDRRAGARHHPRHQRDHRALGRQGRAADHQGVPRRGRDGIEQRYDIYDLFLRFPEPLAPRALRREIGERISRDGEVLCPLDPGEVRRELAVLAAAGVEAVAVCFLHSYRNPAHELAVAELAAREFPALAVSLSAEVVPELREYERATTTLANAFVQPLMDRYIARIEAELRRRGFAGRFYLMQSAGG